jgi:hypothetical protein
VAIDLNRDGNGVLKRDMLVPELAAELVALLGLLVGSQEGCTDLVDDLRLMRAANSLIPDGVLPMRLVTQTVTATRHWLHG